MPGNTAYCFPKVACACSRVPRASNSRRTTFWSLEWVQERSPRRSTSRRCRIRPRWRSSMPPYRSDEWLSRRRSPALSRSFARRRRQLHHRNNDLRRRRSHAEQPGAVKEGDPCQTTTTSSSSEAALEAAHFARQLAPTGKRILILERGDWLKREALNWDAKAVFVENRYISPDTWYDRATGRRSSHRSITMWGAQRNCMARRCTVCGGKTSGTARIRRHLPAWPIGYEEMEPFYTKAEQMYQVHGASAV